MSTIPRPASAARNPRVSREQGMSRAQREQSMSRVQRPGRTPQRTMSAPPKPALDDAEETNINVVVRCRGRSEREVRENSGVVVATLPKGVKGGAVELSMGPNAISNKTYQFDKVFSAAADQSIIFDDVVTPILSEVLGGYNCTIFAYGQTGTGKTYTMSGDMSTDSLGLLSDAAGIIPRVLHSLFGKIETEELECSLKCSFIELYNEELRDLLTSDDNVKLKIYDDSSKKNHGATLVQGMEECHIKSAAQGVALLQEGSYRRQVAATKCNDLSSRSHTIFTITTYMKQVTETGEDTICAGKLNLVDLAGSENIQRSGAENKRAAEAGLINKSLLTLGRVINALVDKSSHIPYRESKLTRLLQDSLGGRTKTCIIATVSPAKSNLEETISTLDYAFRAKNIRNKPQINSMVSKKTLLREFTTEIERLKSELMATRQRNGVYLSNEQYEEMTTQSESRRILSEEQKARIEAIEVNLRSKAQDLFNLTNNFLGLKKENESTKAEVEAVTAFSRKTEEILSQTRQLLIQETTMKEAHYATERQLQDIGKLLISTVNDTIQDIGGLQDKVARQEDLHRTNKRKWDEMAGNNTVVTQVDATLQIYRETQSSLWQATQGQITAAVASRLESLTPTKAGQMQDSGLHQAAEDITNGVTVELDKLHTQMHSSFSALGKELKTLFDDLSRQMATHKEEADKLRAALDEANSKNTALAEEASSRLAEAVQEQIATERQRNENLVQQFSVLFATQATAMLTQASSTNASNLQTLQTSTQTDISHLVDGLQSSNTALVSGMDLWSQRGISVQEKVHKSRDELKNRVRSDWTALEGRSNGIQKAASRIPCQVIEVVKQELNEASEAVRTELEAYEAATSMESKKLEGARGLLRDLGGQLATSRMDDYTITGSTPAKKQWTFPTTLPATRIPCSPRPAPSPAKSRSPRKLQVFKEGLKEVAVNVLAASQNQSKQTSKRGSPIVSAIPVAGSENM